MSDDILFQPQAKRTQAKYRGPTDSQDLNEVVDGLLADMADAASAINTLHVRTKRQALVLQQQVDMNRERMRRQESLEDVDNLEAALEGTDLQFYHDFRSTQSVILDQFPEARRCRIDPMYGQATVPLNGAVNRFHLVNPVKQEIILADTLAVTVDRSAIVGATFVEGETRNAFNGDPTSVWLEQAYFPLYSDVDSVTVTVDIDVPYRFSTNANVVQFFPFPAGNMDINSVYYSVDDTDPAIWLPSFPTAGDPNALASRYFFSTLGMTKLRIELTQRHWTEFKDQKLFLYGFQEIGVLLAEFDKTNTGVFLNNNAFALEVTTPDGYSFNNLTDFISTPTYATAGSDTGIDYNIYSDAAFTQLLWDSAADPTLRSTPVSVPGSLSTIYIVGNLRFLTASNVTPVLDEVTLRYTVT